MTGATGLLGRALCGRLAAEEVPFRVLSRNPGRARSAVRGAISYEKWEPIERGAPWVASVQGASAVVHLASPLVRRSNWSTEHSQVVYDNCVVGSRGIVSAVAQASARPPVFISASTVGYYPGDSEETPLDETADGGGDFLGRLVADWEAAAAHVAEFGVREVRLRLGLVLARNGALRRLRAAARLGFGRPASRGADFQPWIHVEDVVGLILLAIEDERARGPLNCVAPEALSGNRFMACIRSQLGVRGGLPIPPRLVPGAVRVTAGRHVAPRGPASLGFHFAHPQLESALRTLRRQARTATARPSGS